MNSNSAEKCTKNNDKCKECRIALSISRVLESNCTCQSHLYLQSTENFYCRSSYTWQSSQLKQMPKTFLSYITHWHKLVNNIGGAIPNFWGEMW